MKIHYELAEQRSTEGVVELTDDEAHAYLKATNGTARREAVRSAIWRHAEEAADWADNETLILSKEPDKEEDDDLL